MGEGEPDAAKSPSPLELFLAFLSVGVVGFGGVMPWARRMIVEQRRWLTPEEFNDQLALCQFLPGSNVVNLAVAVGARFAGSAGAVAALAGVLGLPVVIAMLVASGYAYWGNLEIVRGALTGVAAAASGLVIANAVKMATPLLRRRLARALPFILLAFFGVGILRWPLEWVVLALCPLSVAANWQWRS